MKLHYFKDPHGNFGDDLNPWLWNKLMPGVLDEDPKEIFVGIGTLINHRLPEPPIKHVFGSGVGYGELPRNLERFRFHAVRGFESARALGIDKRHVISDAAVLLSVVDFRKAPVTDRKVAFIPHTLSTRYFDWETVCNELSIHYVSPTLPVDQFLFELTRCEKVVCEAMHGAIAADSLRIPWIPVRCYDFISTFKWADWLSTIALPYNPSSISSLYDIDRRCSGLTFAKNFVKRCLKDRGVWSASWTPAPPRTSGSRARLRAIDELRRATGRSPYMSSDQMLESHAARYMDLLGEFVKTRGME